MLKKSNKTAKRLAIISGILLFISGINGVGFVELVGRLVATYISDNTVIMTAFAVLILIASFGGITVIVGGILIGRGRTTTGKILVRLGSGVGILSLIGHVFLAIYSQNASIASFLSIGMMGIILAVIAPFYAK